MESTNTVRAYPTRGEVNINEQAVNERQHTQNQTESAGEHMVHLAKVFNVNKILNN